MEPFVKPYFVTLITVAKCIREMTGEPFSVNELAIMLGYPNSKALYAILRNADNIPRPMAEQIHRLYPKFRVEWLTGESEDMTTF